MNRFVLCLLPLGLMACLPEDPPKLPLAPAGDVAIPAALHGRWGLSEAECTADPAIAKGLMTVDATTLVFYESRGSLIDVAQSGPTRLEGSFAFVGEGQTWARQETLDLQEEGRVLIRREYGEGAAPGPFRYFACP